MPLNRGGMGTIAWHACNAMMEAGLLHRVIAPETGAAGRLEPLAQDLPWPFRKAMAAMNRLRWHSAHDAWFDRWAASRIESGMDYYGWMHQSLACIRRCHQGGGRAWVDRGSVEPRLQRRWLVEEYARHGLRRDPMDSRAVNRMVQEADETDFVVAASTLVARSYREVGYPESKIVVNYPGVDLKVFGGVERREPQNRMRFVFVGQLSLQKGIPDLLRAWKKLAPSDAELILAGVVPPGEESIILPLLRDAPHVTWKGHCQDVPSLLREGDVLVLPSAQDGFGLVVLEAFASGLLVIVSDRVGARDCVIEGKNGFIFPFGNEGALGERLAWCLKERERVREMRKEARETAGRFSWEAYGQRLVSFFKT